MDTIHMPRGHYKQVVDQFAADIRTGKLPPGTRLPTHRKLAQQENIALVTASKIYAELESMGLVSGETGRGTFVREAQIPLGHGIDQQAVSDSMLDLNFNSPSLPGQKDMLRDALRQLSISGDIESLLHYQPHAGRTHERAIIATHLESAGLTVNSSHVLITSGAQHGLAVSVMALLRPGDVVAVDSLIYPGFKVLAEVHGIELAPIPLIDNAEPNLDALLKLCEQRPVRAIYTMPTMHNPLGWVMTLEQREQLVAIAQHHELLIIEDAAYAFHAENPPPPIAALAPERTVYVSGLSKSVATGLRLGYLAAPKSFIAKIERCIRATTWNTPALMTALACRWVEDGTVKRLEAEKQQDAKARQAIARKIFNNMEYISHPASYLIWLPLPEEARADQVVMDLMKANISVSTAEPFATTEHVPHAIRLALGSISLEQLPEALETVKKTIELHSY